MDEKQPKSRADRPSRVTVPEWGRGMELLDFLERRFPRVERRVWADRIERGLVLAEAVEAGSAGEAAAAGRVVEPGERYRYFREVEAEPAVPFAERVVLQRPGFLLVDKPPFLPVTPGGPYVRECLLYRLIRYSGEADLAPVHRLDRDTAGLVLFARRPEDRGAYGELFARGEVEKEYRAIADLSAVPDAEPGQRWTRESRLVRGEPWFRMREAPFKPGGEPDARTEVELLERRGDRGLFALRPSTGKKHQLRVHMAALGFPIEGDRYYPHPADEEEEPDFSRPLCLSAHRLAFTDPAPDAAGGERIEAASGWRLDLSSSFPYPDCPYLDPTGAPP